MSAEHPRGSADEAPDPARPSDEPVIAGLPTGQDILDSTLAGPRVIRGIAVRSAGYFIGIGLALISAPLLTRHLGVADYGSYIVVASVIAVAMIFADAGMMAVGVREYSLRTGDDRGLLLRNLISIRLAASVAAGIGAVAFSLIAGYDDLLVAGCAFGASGLVLTIAQRTYAIPLAVALRLELFATLDLLRQALAVTGIVVLVMAGAGLGAFFVLPVPVAFVVLLVTIVVVRGYGGIRPSVTREESRLLAAQVPAAAAAALGALFYRVGMIMMSLLGAATQTGYFGLSVAVLDVFVPVAALVAGSAFPILARAEDADRQRLAFAFQQLFDASVILGVGASFVLVAGAEPLVAFLGGSEFEPTIPVLRIQALALSATFLVTLFGFMLWAVRARRQLAVGNLFGLATAVALTAVLIPIWEAKGAAVAMVIAEGLLAVWLGVALLASRAHLRPGFGVIAKTIVAVAVAGLVTVLPLAPLADVILGGAAYLAVLLVLRAIPVDVWRATIGAWRRP